MLPEMRLQRHKQLGHPAVLFTGATVRQNSLSPVLITTEGWPGWVVMGGWNAREVTHRGTSRARRRGTAQCS